MREPSHRVGPRRRGSCILPPVTAPRVTAAPGFRPGLVALAAALAGSFVAAATGRLAEPLVLALVGFTTVCSLVLLLRRHDASAPPASAAPPFDPVVALERCAGSSELMHQVLAGLPLECTQQAAAVGEAIRDGDARRVVQAAHRLKGSLQCIAAGPAEAAAKALEHGARDGDLARGPAQLTALNVELERLYAAILTAKKSP